MRKAVHKVLKKFFCGKLVHIRNSEGLTQAKMANALLMDERSYADLEHGKTGCSAVTLALFLIYVCHDVPGFLEDLRVAFEAADEQVA